MGMYKFKGLKEIEDRVSDKHPDMEVVASKGDGSPWSKRFYSSNKDLMRGFDKHAIGDWIEIKFDETRFKNMVSVGAGSKPDVPAGGYSNSPGNSGGGSAPAKTYGGNANVTRKDGTSRGADTNRSAAIYLAKEVINMVYTASDLKKMGVVNTVGAMGDAAQLIFGYIANGDLPLVTANTPKGTAPSGDPLSPPNID